jgi:hypothetical protein
MKTVNEKRRVELDKAIAYFMGWRIDNSFPDKGRIWRKGNAIEVETTFKFHSDWNWIMEVFSAVNKLEGYSVSISPGRCSVYNFGELDWEAPHKEPEIDLHEAVYRCLGEFIESYNAKQLNV